MLVKPSAGGGGKGMRMVRSPRELAAVLPICRSEARAAFGDDSLYLERGSRTTATSRSRSRSTGSATASTSASATARVQRRHQKILEESPSPAMSPRAAASSPSARSRPSSRPATRTSGTLEFLVDNDGNAYFIEINCRIQVEHPVTEMLTGIDLVALQIRIAAGEPLGLHPGRRPAARPRDRVPDQRRGPGARLPARRRHIERFNAPGGPGVRFDSHAYQGYEVPPFYDSLLGKLIVWGPTREAAIARGRAALSELVVEGVVTNVQIHRALLTSEPFLEGRFTTNLLDRVGSAAFLAAEARA